MEMVKSQPIVPVFVKSLDEVFLTITGSKENTANKASKLEELA